MGIDKIQHESGVTLVLIHFPNLDTSVNSFDFAQLCRINDDFSKTLSDKVKFVIFLVILY